MPTPFSPLGLRPTPPPQMRVCCDFHRNESRELLDAHHARQGLLREAAEAAVATPSPSPGDEDAEEAARARAAETLPQEVRCPDCEEAEDDCTCRLCAVCDARFLAEDDCSYRGGCARCPGCCVHQTCTGCERRGYRDNMCSNCEECESCCGCRYCDACGESHSSSGTDWCSACDNCQDSCSCEGASDEDPDGEGDMPSNAGAGRPTWVAPRVEPVFHKGGTFKINPIRRYIGVELEVARSDTSSRYQIDPVVAAWEGTAVVRDGSLADGGYEICTPPTSGDLFVQRIETLCEALGRSSAAVTTECGFHVHVDARDLTYRALQRLVALYSHVEPALFEMVPRSRRENRFCQRCGPRFLQRGIAAALDEAATKSPKRAKTALIKAVYEENIEDRYGEERFEARKGAKYDDARYAALNLHSWFYRGTIELRLAAGTTNATKVVNWAILFASLLDWAASNTDADLAKLPKDPLEALVSLAPTATVVAWTRKRHEKFRHL